MAAGAAAASTTGGGGGGGAAGCVLGLIGGDTSPATLCRSAKLMTLSFASALSFSFAGSAARLLMLPLKLPPLTLLRSSSKSEA
jgi:hypothetical protein